MEIVLQYGLQGIVAFGTVGAISLILKKRFGKELENDVKLYLLIGIAFLVGFIPADLGNFILNHLKVAIAAGVGINAVNTVVNKING